MKKIIITPSGSEVVDMTAEEISTNETNVAENLVKEQELETAKQAKADLKASAKAKLIAGEALTEEEANTIVL
ncbi:hypothetical protein [uncultured Mediterranean phage uvMED]|nr:hypothetical protein [uncultured Mediterranean phage uvMED]BAR17646.1 hypothetical protein [uncultured Mediterranean phage uvMED]